MIHLQYFFAYELGRPVSRPPKTQNNILPQTSYHFLFNFSAFRILCNQLLDLSAYLLVNLSTYHLFYPSRLFYFLESHLRVIR
jgi:hypothetical protein